MVNELFDRHHFDGVLNLAARAGVRYNFENPHVYLTTNAHGTLNLLEAMRQHGVKKKFWLQRLLSIPDICPGKVNARPYTVVSIRGLEKAAEAMCHSYHYLFGLDVSVVRYFTVYGPCGRPDMALLSSSTRLIEVYPFRSMAMDPKQEILPLSMISREVLAALKSRL